MGLGYCYRLYGCSKGFSYDECIMIAVATGTTKKPVLKPSSVVADPVVFRTEQGQQNTEWLDKVSAEHQQPKSRAEGVLEMLRAFIIHACLWPRATPGSDLNTSTAGARSDARFHSGNS